MPPLTLTSFHVARLCSFWPLEPKLTLCRTVVTGILNATLVYAVAYYVQLWLTKHVTRQRRTSQHGHGAVLDVAAARPHANSTRTSPSLAVSPSAGVVGVAEGYVAGDDRVSDQSCLDRFRKHISDVSTLCTLSGYASDSIGQSVSHTEEGEGGDDGRPEDALRALESGSGSATAQASSSSLDQRRILGAGWVWMQQNIFLMSSILLFLLIGLPLSCLRHTDLFLDLGFLFTVWLTFTSTQTRVKQHINHSHRLARQQTPNNRRFLTALGTLLNPVLWTSLFLLCYGLAKSHIRAEPTAAVVARFKTNNTVSDLIAHHINTSYLSRTQSSSPASSSSPRLPLGAGDVATSILNAGIVSWGLKLFEYRHQIISRGGLTVLLTSALVSLLNVLAWPLLVHALGVRPAASDLSFAARSVTIALGGPAMDSLGGDAGVNAVGVVVNGICFQLVAGCFVGGDGFAGTMMKWMASLQDRCKTLLLRPTTSRRIGDDAQVRGRHLDMEKGRISVAPTSILERPNPDNLGSQGNGPRYSLDTTGLDERRPPRTSTPTSGAQDLVSQDKDSETRPCHPHNKNNNYNNGLADGQAVAAQEDVSTVAAGVTIGINAAAMGTAHLYEQNSQAAPYSALSMTVFGVFTVLFTVQSPMVEWLVRMVGS